MLVQFSFTESLTDKDPMKNSERINRVRKGMAENKIDVLICRLPENILFLSGYWPMSGNAYLIFPLEGKPICISPSCFKKEVEKELCEAEPVYYSFGVVDSGNPHDEVAKIIRDTSRGKNWRSVGIENDFELIAPPWNAAEPVVPADSTRNMLADVFKESSFLGITPFLNLQRARKTPYEVEKLRRANEIATIGLKTFADKVAPGKSGIDLVAEVEKQIMLRGTGYNQAMRVRAFAQVATGAAETAIGHRPNIISTTRKLEKGDLALLELAVVVDGYWADRTQVRVAGKPDSQQKEIFEIVKSAQDAAISRIKAGQRAGAIDRAAREYIAKKGYEKQFVHITGHGIGFRYHEPIPIIRPDNNLILEKGMVTTIEPGIYFSEMGGIRLEDDIVLTEEGFEVLGPFESELAE